MPFLVRYHLDDAEWRRLSRETARRASDLRPVLKQAGEYMLLEVDERFRSERSPDGEPWAPLAARTLVAGFERRGKRRAFKKRGGETKAFVQFRAGKKILQDAGTRGGLRGSITYEATRSSLAHGTAKIYGAIHQLGGKAGRGLAADIPARPYLGYTERNLARIRSLVAAFLREVPPGS